MTWDPPPHQWHSVDANGKPIEGTSIPVKQEDEIFALLRQSAAIHAFDVDAEDLSPLEKWERLAQKERAEEFLRAIAALTVQAMGPEALPEKVPVTPEPIVKAAAKAREINAAHSRNRTEKRTELFAPILRDAGFEFPTDPNKPWKEAALVALRKRLTTPKGEQTVGDDELRNWLRNHTDELKKALEQLSSSAQR